MIRTTLARGSPAEHDDVCAIGQGIDKALRPVPLQVLRYLETDRKIEAVLWLVRKSEIDSFELLLLKNTAASWTGIYPEDLTASFGERQQVDSRTTTDIDDLHSWVTEFVIQPVA
jgi:hypothetical protein